MNFRIDECVGKRLIGGRDESMMFRNITNEYLMNDLK